MICPMPRLEVIGVIVSDMQRAIDFYERLGLRFPEDPDPMGHGHVETRLPGGLRFTLDTEQSIRSFAPDWSPPSGGHRVAVAFRCDSPEDVDRLYRALDEAGAGGQWEPWDAFWGQRYAQARDPDGNVIDLFAPLER
jgi:catechol 2,3-dioxygenase-like lactoylglutathione lyase family enzyme